MLVPALAAVGLLAATTPELKADTSEIVIGQCAALSGPASALGLEMRSGLKAALDETNAKGGASGKALKLVSADDQYEPEKTVDCTSQMVEETHVTALAGYVGTPTTKVALPIVEESKTPLVGIFSGAGVFREPVQHYVINVRASYEEEVEQIVKYMTGKLGNKRIAVLYQNDSFGASGLAATEKALRARSLEVAAKGSFERNTTAVKAGLASILAGNPDAVILVGPYKPVAEFVRQAQAASLKATFAAISFVGTESLLGELGSAGDGLIISEVVPSPVDASLPVAKAYREALVKSDGSAKQTYASFEGYITGRLLVAGLEKAGGNKEKLVEAIESLSALDLGGITLSYSAAKHQGSTSVFLTRAKDGAAHPFDPQQ